MRAPETKDKDHQEEMYNDLLGRLESFQELLAEKGPELIDLVISEMREMVILGDYSRVGLDVNED